MRTPILALCVTMVAADGVMGRADAQEPGRAEQTRAMAVRARAALELPRTVDSVRKHGGIPESEMGVVIGDVRRRGVPASEARDIFAVADTSIRQHGPVNNFGAFVQGRLAAGLRGRDLARAIRDEHARRGIGKGKVRSDNRGKASDRAGTGAKGNTSAKGTPNAKASSSAKGATSKTTARDTRDAAARARQAATTTPATKAATKALPAKVPPTKTKTKGRP